MIDRRNGGDKKKYDTRLSIESGGRNIIIVFGDISGFRLWTRRAGHASKSFKTLMKACISRWMELRDKGYSLKLLGDGFMASKEMTNGHNCQLALSVLEDAWKITTETKRLIDQSNYPRPDGFRVRISSGEVAIVKMRDGIDYLGYMVNTTKDLLRVECGIPCIAHESVKELLNTEKSSHINFKRVKVSGEFRSIEKADLDALWSFEINDVS